MQTIKENDILQEKYNCLEKEYKEYIKKTQEELAKEGSIIEDLRKQLNNFKENLESKIYNSDIIKTISRNQSTALENNEIKEESITHQIYRNLRSIYDEQAELNGGFQLTEDQNNDIDDDKVEKSLKFNDEIDKENIDLKEKMQEKENEIMMLQEKIREKELLIENNIKIIEENKQLEAQNDNLNKFNKEMIEKIDLLNEKLMEYSKNKIH